MSAVDKVLFRRRPQGPRLPDDEGVRPLPGGRRQLQHLDASPQEAARGPHGDDNHHDDPEAPNFIAANKGHAIFDGHIVIVFDECHRSQFGDMHTAITKAFHRYHSSASRGRRSSLPMPARAGTCNCARLSSEPSATNCTRTRSSTRSPTRTSCPSASTTSTRSRRLSAWPTSRCPGSIAKGAAAPERISRRRVHARALPPEDHRAPRRMRMASIGSAGSTPCSLRVRSRRPDLLQRVRMGSRIFRTPSGSRSG